MRFPRQTSIFRGPLDPVPVISVLFLLVVFLLLGSLLYTPGVLVRFENSSGSGAETITVTRSGTVVFNGVTNAGANLEALRSGDLKQVAPDQALRLKVESGADPKLVEQVRELFQVRLPTNDIVNLAGTDNPTVVIAVNFRGQYFFENKLMQDLELKRELRNRLKAVAPNKLTLVVWADKAAENDVVMHLYQLGREAGISEFILAERPPPGGRPGS